MSVKAPVQRLTIASAQGNYPVDFPLTVAEAVQAAKEHRDVRIIADQHVHALYRESFAALEGIPMHLVPALESEKMLAGVEHFLAFLQQHESSKKSTVLAIGGGIVQDIATFSSHIFYRGIPWVFLPTTLLSMSDSSIGAKCGINFGAFKNQLGVFQSPSRVIICERFLDTLADDDVRSGYGEILKLLLTGPLAGYEKLERAVDADGFRGPLLSELIRDSLAVKKGVIEEDEYEADYRRILNYGHTFCHSLESITDHEVPHGLAVAWGVDLANYVSMRRGMLSKAMYTRIHDFIHRHFAVGVKAPYDAAQIVNGMRRDKKAAAGEVSLILLEQPGKLQIVQTKLDAALEGHVSEYLEKENLFSRG